MARHLALVREAPSSAANATARASTGVARASRNRLLKQDGARGVATPDDDSAGNSHAIQEFIAAALRMALLDLHDAAALSTDMSAARGGIRLVSSRG